MLIRLSSILLPRPMTVLLFDLFLSVPPDILSSGTSDGEVSVLEGENATLSCKASGRPPPRVFWRREKSDFILMRGVHDPLIQGKRYRPCIPTPRLSFPVKRPAIIILLWRARSALTHESGTSRIVKFRTIMHCEKLRLDAKADRISMKK